MAEDDAMAGHRFGMGFGKGALAAFALAWTLPGTAAGGQGLPRADARQIDVDLSRAGAPVDRFFDLSVGSDYAGTLIRPANLEHLRLAADELGFRYLRFHDIFHDALGTVKKRNGRIVYDWIKVDQLYDAMLARGIKPFVELGFTPGAMKTSPQTIFYWKGNTSHPEPKAWAALIDAFVRHLRDRYGAQAVRSRYFEVWNEPNLDGFWEKADKPAYMALYESSARTIKAIDPELRVGGPATAGAAWVPEFLDRAATRGILVDFIATHTYGVDGGFLDERGQDDNSCRPIPIRSWATCARCAGRSRRRSSPGCRCSSPNGAPATTRATRSTTAMSAPPTSSPSCAAFAGSHRA